MGYPGALDPCLVLSETDIVPHQTKTHLSTTLAHIDFVKALVVIPSLQVAVTGSSDKDIRVWDLRPLSTRDFGPLLLTNKVTPVDADKSTTLPESSDLPPIAIPTGAAPPTPKSLLPLPVLLSLKSHTRPIERLAHYRIPKAGVEGGDSGRVALLSADSLGALKTWELWREADGTMKGEVRSDIRPHEIGIYDLLIGDGELWTASADNSVLYSTFDPSSPSTPPTPVLRIPHPCGVKSILPLSLALPSLNSNHVLTGAIDESIRIFDLAELDDQVVSKVPWAGIPAEGKLPGMVQDVEGHSHDVIDLGVFMKDVDGKREAWILSASVDGTLRRWKWPEMLVAAPPKKVLVQVDEPTNGMTEEEERELELLMGDD
jgi:WD40 repeat protein